MQYVFTSTTPNRVTQRALIRKLFSQPKALRQIRLVCRGLDDLACTVLFSKVKLRDAWYKVDRHMAITSDLEAGITSIFKYTVELEIEMDHNATAHDAWFKMIDRVIPAMVNLRRIW